jgi:hypothetical protein
MRINTSKAGCLCRLNAQSGFLSFVKRKKLVRILIPKRTMSEAPLILWKSQMNTLPPYFKITTQAYFSVKNKVSDGTEHRAWGKGQNPEIANRKSHNTANSRQSPLHEDRPLPSEDR